MKKTTFWTKKRKKNPTDKERKKKPTDKERKKKPY